MFRTAALVPPYGAEGAARFGLYDVMLAVHTIEPLIPSWMNFLAAAVAQFHTPNTFRLNSCFTCSSEKSNAGWCFVMPMASQ